VENDEYIQYERSNGLLVKARSRTDTSNDRITDVLEPNACAPCHVIKGHVDVGDVDDVTHCWRRKHHLLLVDSSHAAQEVSN